MDLLKISIILIVAILHLSIVNKLEKSFTQVVWGPQGWTKRPTSKCGINQKIHYNIEGPLHTACYGMPSGHAETGVLVFLLLFLWRFIPLSWAIVGIMLTGLQRILWKRHTILQVIIGIIIGLVYVSVYYTSSRIHWTMPVLICVMIILFISIITVLLISHKQVNTDFPVWVDKSIYPLIYKKQINTSIISKVLYYTGHIVIDSDYGFVTWIQLENLLDEMLLSLHNKPDIVIGIKTGGAILAGYVSQRLQIPLDFIRTKRATYKCSTDVQSEIQAVQFALESETQAKTRYQVCEKPKYSVKGKTVLLIDETAYSGGTISSAKEYLLEAGAQHVDVFVLSAIKNTNLYDYTYGKGFVAWPWSFDN